MTSKGEGALNLFDLVSNNKKDEENSKEKEEIETRQRVTERKLLQWEMHDYSAYGNMKPEYYFSEDEIDHFTFQL